MIGMAQRQAGLDTWRRGDPRLLSGLSLKMEVRGLEQIARAVVEAASSLGTHHVVYAIC